MNDQSLRYLRQGISRGLSKDYFLKQNLSAHIEKLLNRLKIADKQATGADERPKGAENDNPPSVDDTAREELNRYVVRLAAYLPDWISRSVRWLRKPERLVIRIVVSLALIVGSLFSFLPILGLWMLPLGLIIIAQDLPFLQRPLVRLLAWTERKVRDLRGRFKNKEGGIN